jgi:hypothetical protein
VREEADELHVAPGIGHGRVCRAGGHDDHVTGRDGAAYAVDPDMPGAGDHVHDLLGQRVHVGVATRRPSQADDADAGVGCQAGQWIRRPASFHLLERQPGARHDRHGVSARRAKILVTCAAIAAATRSANVAARAAVAEIIFQWPGLGRWMADAVLRGDQATIMAYVMFTSVLFLVVNLAVDVVYAYLDRRVVLGE